MRVCVTVSFTVGVQAAGAQPFPAVFLSFPSAKDEDWSRRHPGKATAHVIAGELRLPGLM